MVPYIELRAPVQRGRSDVRNKNQFTYDQRKLLKCLYEPPYMSPDDPVVEFSI